jgi:hypothetical protein
MRPTRRQRLVKRERWVWACVLAALAAQLYSERYFSPFWVWAVNFGLLLGLLAWLWLGKSHDEV